MKLRQVLINLGRKVPQSLSEPWDFPGYQCGKKDMNAPIHKILLCLDYSEEVHETALKIQPDLILTHHPFFFGKKKEVLESDPLKEILTRRIEEELQAPIYSFHTDFDKTEGGMNDTLMEYLDIKDVKVAEDGLLRIGNLPEEMEIKELCLYLCQKFGFASLPYIGDEEKLLRKIGLIAGGAASDYPLAFKEGVDCFISGDCSHHTRLELRRYGYSFINLPHECEEIGFLIGMSKLLTSIYPFDITMFEYEEPFREVVYEAKGN